MAGKCKAEYKNLNLIQSFSEQGYAVVQWAEQVCKNEEWLRQFVEKLNYLTPPAIRKRFAPVLVDPLQSYGYHIDEENKLISFDSARAILKEIDFSNNDLIDESKSDVYFESWLDNQGNIKKSVTVPRVSLTKTKYFGDCRGEGVNSFWYVGFDKNKQYQVRPDWINDYFDSEIPAICRAQTFTVEESGFLESVDLHIENNGVTGSNWSSPLIVQIFPTEPRVVEKTSWDKKKKMSIGTGVNETIYWPVGNPRNALATAIFQPDNITPGFQNLLFDNPVKVTEGEHYALVFSSPLSHWEHCPRIGGWGRNCAVDKYSGGDAFLSDNNGRSWVRYGRNDLQVEYRFGQLTPLDFAFQCHVNQYSSEYDTTASYYLYLKPIKCNPMTSVNLRKDSGVEGGSLNDVEFCYEASVNGRDWVEFNNNGYVYFNRDSNGDYPTTLFVRARIKSKNATATPYIHSMNLYISTELPQEMYVRTPFYKPKLTPMLGANVWGRVYAPFELTPENSNKIECDVEIIQDRLVKEDFKIITVSELDYYLNLEDSNGDPILNPNSIKNVDDDTRANYLIENPTVIENLKKHNVYVKPYSYNNIKYLLSFDGGVDGEGNVVKSGFKFNRSPAYPIQECLIQPSEGESVQGFGEGYDFKVDYENDELLFYDNYITGEDESIDFLDYLPVGSLTVRYNPVFIQDLKLEEVGDRVDGESGLSQQGLILDYFKESFLITDSEIESRRLNLRVVPVDPIREVVLYHGDDETVLYEDVDFSVDYDNQQLVFPIVNIDKKSSILSNNDIVTVVYTPNIEDAGISIGYHVKRSDLSHNIKIKPNFIEYK